MTKETILISVAVAGVAQRRTEVFSLNDKNETHGALVIDKRLK